MSTGASIWKEVFVTVPPNAASGSNVRMFQTVVGQDDGSMVAVLVEPTVLLSSETAQPLTPMSKDQGDQIIKLLKRIADRLDNG